MNTKGIMASLMISLDIFHVTNDDTPYRHRFAVVCVAQGVLYNYRYANIY